MLDTIARHSTIGRRGDVAVGSVCTEVSKRCAPSSTVGTATDGATNPAEFFAVATDFFDVPYVEPHDPTDRSCAISTNNNSRATAPLVELGNDSSAKRKIESR